MESASPSDTAPALVARAVASHPIVSLPNCMETGAHHFNLGRYPPGESRSEVFPRPGVVRMFCDIHSEMGGTILVLDSWLFTRPDASGEYRIEGVPAGRHRVVAWHESAGADTASITVAPTGETRLDFELAE